MNKAELITRVANASEVSKAAAERVIDALASTITDTLKSGGEVTLTGVGTFSSKQRDARVGRNPKTGEPAPIPAGVAPKFKPSVTLKKALNK